MLESVFEQVHDVKHLITTFGLVLGAQVENDRLAPLVELSDSIQQIDNQLSRNINAAFVCLNLVDGFDGIDDNQRVYIRQHIVQLL